MRNCRFCLFSSTHQLRSWQQTCAQQHALLQESMPAQHGKAAAATASYKASTQQREGKHMCTQHLQRAINTGGMQLCNQLCRLTNLAWAVTPTNNPTNTLNWPGTCMPQRAKDDSNQWGGHDSREQPSTTRVCLVHELTRPVTSYMAVISALVSSNRARGELLHLCACHTQVQPLSTFGATADHSMTHVIRHSVSPDQSRQVAPPQRAGAGSHSHSD